jgi:hypothetical protein
VCRSAGVAFVSLHPFGWSAFLFFDIASAVPSSSSCPLPGGSGDGPARKRSLSCLRPLGLADALCVPLARLRGLGASPLLCVLCALLRRGLPPSSSLSSLLDADDGDALLDQRLLADVASQAGRELAPISAVIGGIAAQEMIKELMRERSPSSSGTSSPSTPTTVQQEPSVPRPARGMMSYSGIDCVARLVCVD